MWYSGWKPSTYSVDLVQIPSSVAMDLGLYYFFRHNCLNIIYFKCHKKFWHGDVFEVVVWQENSADLDQTDGSNLTWVYTVYSGTSVKIAISEWPDQTATVQSDQGLGNLRAESKQEEGVTLANARTNCFFVIPVFLMW